MNCPRLPALPSSTVSKIEPSWLRELFACIEFAMTHPAGDGETILLQEGGTLRAVNTGGGGGDGEVSNDAFDGAFAVFADLEKGLVICREGGEESESGNAGMISVGSRREVIKEKSWKLKSGVVFADIIYDDESEKYTIDVFFEDDIPQDTDLRRYVARIASVEYDEDAGTVQVSQIHTEGDIDVRGRWTR